MIKSANSCDSPELDSIIRISFLTKHNIFSCIFKTDSLDRWIYYNIHKNGGKVYILDEKIEHELSVMNYNKYMNLSRYNQVIKYETYFMKLNKSKIEYLIYLLRIIFRIFKFLKSKNTFKYIIPTLSHILHTFFLNKEKILKKNINYDQNR